MGKRERQTGRETEQQLTGQTDNWTTEYCIAHGGGVRCKAPDCTTGAARSGGLKGFCKAHGGGERCKQLGCLSAASKGGVRGYCISHGGGKRCRTLNCKAGARGTTNYCAKHRAFAAIEEGIASCSSSSVPDPSSAISVLCGLIESREDS